jgi:bile acid:Na+ symporter, BASS family
MLTRILTQYTRFYALWVVLFGLAAFLLPEPFIYVKGGMKWFFALTMFGIGVALEWQDFKRIFQHPSVILIGSATQFTLMPFGAYVFSTVLGLPPEIAVGLILTGSAPGAMASNVMCYIAKADTAYSVSLTTVSTLLAPVLTPLLTLFLAGARLDVAFSTLFLSVCTTVVLPLLAGFLVRALFRHHIQPVLVLFPALSSTFIAVICAVVIASNRDYLPQITGTILFACVALNLYGLLGGYGVASLFRLDVPRRRTLSIEIGMQNAGLGVVLALEHLDERAAIPAAIFVFVCIFTASMLPMLWRRADGEAERAQDDTEDNGGHGQTP